MRKTSITKDEFCSDENLDVIKELIQIVADTTNTPIHWEQAKKILVQIEELKNPPQETINIMDYTY